MQLELFTLCKKCSKPREKRLYWLYANSFCEGCFLKSSIQTIKQIQSFFKSKVLQKLSRKRQGKKRMSNPSFRAKKNVRQRIGKILKRLLSSNHPNRKASKSQLIGCSRIELKSHLENQFTQGMSWDNYGKWHIDHIKPLSRFNLHDFKELEKATHYSNLQPLWAKDNLLKGDKYNEII